MLEQPDLLKSLAIISDATARRSAVDKDDLKPYHREDIADLPLIRTQLASGQSCKSQDSGKYWYFVVLAKASLATSRSLL